MNITSLSMQSLYSTLNTSSVSAASSNCQSSSTSGASGSTDSASVSGPGKLLSELKELSQSNPTEFKKITEEIATQLKSAASKSSDSTQSDFLNSMASNFEKASQSGNFSDLFPQQGGDQSGTAQNTNTAQKAYQSAPPSPPSQGGDDTVSTIFSSALSQIQSDLSESSSSTTT